MYKKLIAVALLLSLCLVIPAIVLYFQNQTYAHDYFRPIMAYDTVLASRKWHPLLARDACACTYAVVSLKEETSPVPPSTWLKSEKWKQTPVLLEGIAHLPETSNQVIECVEQDVWSKPLATRLTRVVTEPGSYYFQMGESLWLYSLPYNVAAHIRYGD
jgi:hypothetical protein